MKCFYVITVSMGIMHNILWVYVLNLDRIPCFWAKLCAFKVEDAFHTWILWRRKDSSSETKRWVCDATHGE